MNNLDNIEHVQELSDQELQSDGGLLLVIAFAIGFWVGYRETHPHD